MVRYLVMRRRCYATKSSKRKIVFVFLDERSKQMLLKHGAMKLFWLSYTLFDLKVTPTLLFYVTAKHVATNS